jgi:hydroxymethylbilane synthase
MAGLRIATRGSKLALWQTEHVARLIAPAAPDIELEIIRIKTSGDIIQDVPLSSVGSSAFFTKEIESALLAGEADIAVHSLKDLASEDLPGLTVGAVLVREDPRDALLSADGSSLADLPAESRVGTSSVRRQAMLRAARPDLELLDLRGNVPTRVGRLDEGLYDAIVLAAAGLKRLGLAHRITEYLGTDAFPPPAGQGAIAVQARAGDTSTLEVVRRLNHAETRARVDAERTFLAELKVGCQAPVGAHAELLDGTLHARAVIAALDGSRAVEVSAVGPASEAADVGRRLAQAARDAGGIQLLEEARQVVRGS